MCYFSKYLQKCASYLGDSIDIRYSTEISLKFNCVFYPCSFLSSSNLTFKFHLIIQIQFDCQFHFSNFSELNFQFSQNSNFQQETRI